MSLPNYNQLMALPDQEWRGFLSLVSIVQKARNVTKMNTFDYGDIVTFVARGVRYRGTVMKFNRKTVAVRTISGTLWRVSPSLLQRVESTEKVPA